ncbi:MAG: 50S ribosome-binding GTPase [Clostridiaceae bacterium]|nr:50S ribosome-binding GTPase [Clostridiaceae bacterium]
MTSMNFINDILTKTKDELEKMIPVNIMVIGKTGVGKSTLINNIFREQLAETGIGKPVTRHLRKISKEGIPINIYDTRGIELDEKTQHEVRDEINNEIDRINKENNAKEYIHIIWYCINAQSNRIEDYEVNWIKELSRKLPVIVVLTQSIFSQSKELEKMIDNLNCDISGIQRIVAEPFEEDNFRIDRFGLKELVEMTYEILPEGVKRSFNNAQKVHIQRKVEEARSWSLGYITTSFGVGFTPIPFADAAILAPIQVGMIAHITTIFGVKLEKALLTSIVSSLAGVTGATFLGRTIVANLFKLFPGVGTIAGGIISGSTASIVTTGLAFSYIEAMRIVAENEYKGISVSNEEIQNKVKEELGKQIKKRLK